MTEGVPTVSFTLQDLLGTLLGFAIGGLFFLPPGIAVGYLTNVLSFRRRPILFQALLAIALSFAVDPVVTYLTWRFLSLGAD